MNKRLLMLTLMAVIQGSLLGCNAGSGEGLDDKGSPINNDTETTNDSDGSDDNDDSSASSLEPTLESIQKNIFTPICAKCHKTGSPPQGLNLDSEENSFSLLVDKDANEVPDLKRVAPGDPENSYIIQKLEGTASVGARMPLGGTPLPDEDIDVIKQWILSLAPNVAAANIRPAKTIASAQSPFTSNEICFDKAINASTVYSSTFAIEGAGADGIFNSGDEFTLIPDFDYQVTPISAACLKVSLSEFVNSGNYQIQVNSIYSTPLIDTDGYMVDADQDGEEGGSMAIDVFVINGEIQ